MLPKKKKKNTWKFSPFSLLLIHPSLWFPGEEGASAPSSFSFPFHLLFLPYPLLLHASFEVSLVSLETLSTSSAVFCASSEVLSTSSAVFSASSEVFSASSEVLLAKFLFSSSSDLISAALHRLRHRTRTISEDFRFEFLKFRSLIFGKPKPETCHSTVLLGRSTSLRRHQLVHPTTTGRCVIFTRSRVDLTRGCVSHTCWCVERVLWRVLHPSDPPQCRRQFLRVSVVLRQPSPARVFHAPPVFGFRPPTFLRLFTVFLRPPLSWFCCLMFSVAFTCCCCFLFLMAYLFSLLCLCCFAFVGVLCVLFRNFLLILLISVATVVLSWFSFPVVVVSLTNSKTFQSLHAEITYRSYLATYSEGCADDESEDCSFIFFFLFVIRLCSALFSVHVVRWVASSLDFEEAFPTFM
jgi:hypothetical protein